VRHVGHRAARAHVGQDHDLVFGGENIGGFRHEMDAAKDDIFGFGVRGGELGEFEAVAPVVRPFDDLVTLVVVAEDDEVAAETAARGRDTGIGLFRGKLDQLLRKGLLKHGLAPWGAQSAKTTERLCAFGSPTGMLTSPACGLLHLACTLIPGPSPCQGEGSKTSTPTLSFPLSQAWERGSGGEGLLSLHTIRPDYPLLDFPVESPVVVPEPEPLSEPPPEGGAASPPDLLSPEPEESPPDLPVSGALPLSVPESLPPLRVAPVSP